LSPFRINTHRRLFISRSTSAGILCPWIVIRRTPLTVPRISYPLEYSLGEVLQRCIRALADLFTLVSVSGCSLHAHARHATTGEVKKYQQTLLAPLPGNSCRESTNPTILVSFVLLLFLPLPPLSMEGYPRTHLPPVMSESEEPSSFGPIPLSPYLIHPSVMKLVQESSISEMSHENPYDHVRGFEQLCSTQSRTWMTQDVLKRNLFPSPSLVR
jgi:hypothetical protein